jgi:hypothetical protein
VRRGQITGSLVGDWCRVAIQARRVNAGSAGKCSGGSQWETRAARVGGVQEEGVGPERAAAVPYVGMKRGGGDKRDKSNKTSKSRGWARRGEVGVGRGPSSMVLGPCQLILATSDPAPAPPNALRLDASMSLKKQRRQSPPAPALYCTLTALHHINPRRTLAITHPPDRPVITMCACCYISRSSRSDLQSWRRRFLPNLSSPPPP